MSVDFFVSHAGADAGWAEWLGWQLRAAGFSVELDLWDWQPGQDFVAQIEQALSVAKRVLAVWTPTYFLRPFAQAEWRAAFAAQSRLLDESGQPRILPVLVEPTDIPELYGSLIYLDLVGVSEGTAIYRLRSRLSGGGPPTEAPEFPGLAGGPSGVGGVGTGAGVPGFPGRLPPIWGTVPHRNVAFTGRDGVLSELRSRLARPVSVLVPAPTSPGVGVQALSGMGGVGKTQLAVEYVWRYAADYQLVWWINAGHTETIGGQLAALAARLDLAEPQVELPVAIAAVLDALRRRDGWLLVFDNVNQAEDLRLFLPAGPGQVLITSRNRAGWAELATQLPVDVFDRAESVALLRERVGWLEPAEADRIAAALGDLPLALAQAAGFLGETSMPASQYLALLEDRLADLFADHVPGGYPSGLVATLTTAIDQLRPHHPAATPLLELAAFLAPEPIPLGLLADHPDALDPTLAGVVADPVAFRRLLGLLGRYGVARAEGDSIQLHRLVQAVLRNRLPSAALTARRRQVHALLAAAHPGRPRDPASWPRFQQLMPHLLAADPVDSDDPTARDFLREAGWYLYARGEYQAAADHIRRIHRVWFDALGPDHPDTLLAASNLATYLAALGDPAAARALDEDTLARRRRVLGDDHPETLTSAANLANRLAALGDPAAARALDEDTLARRRRVLGDDHPETLTSAANFAIRLAALGEMQAARQLDEDTLARCRRVLGDDHPKTLTSAANLADRLAALGEMQAARQLDEDTLARRRRVLGDDHPDTQRSAHGGGGGGFRSDGGGSGDDDDAND